MLKLEPGCYLLRIEPNSEDSEHPYYIGTLRLEQRDKDRWIWSGDLYAPVDPAPEPDKGIPSFPRAHHRYYLSAEPKASTLDLSGKTFSLAFRIEDYSGNPPSHCRFDNLARVKPTEKYPKPACYFEGQVVNGNADPPVQWGKVAMGWVSSHFRRLVIEIDTVPGSKRPLKNGNGKTWESVFDSAGLEMKCLKSQTTIPKRGAGTRWELSELHETMCEWRDANDLDQEWRYHLLCVHEIAGEDYERGVMYDASAIDSNHVPREGAAVASHWIAQDDVFGELKGKRFQSVPAAYFRTAVHEIGHALGLEHHYDDSKLMDTSDLIAQEAKRTRRSFSKTIQWEFADEHLLHLRHAPDPNVRPGSVGVDLDPAASDRVRPVAKDAFERFLSLQSSPDRALPAAQDFALEMASLIESFPLGAPVRLDCRLLNTSKQQLDGPHSLGLNGGHVRGWVVDPLGVSREFRPLVRGLDSEHRTCPFEPSEALSGSMTLLRGPQGALFPRPGFYQVMVQVSWPIRIKGSRVNHQTIAATSVLIAPPADRDHDRIANEILATPDAVIDLIIGIGKDPHPVLQRASKHPILAPHFAVIAAKGYARRHRDRAADLVEACRQLGDRPVLSESEIRRMARFIRDATPDEKSSKRVQTTVGLLERFAAHVRAEQRTLELLKSLHSEPRRPARKKRTKDRSR